MIENKRILVVDDDNNIRSYIKNRVEALGHTCDEGADGYQGLQSIQTHEYDLVLADIQMPVMDGLEMIRQMRVLDSDFPVTVIISGHTDKSKMRLAIQQGAHDYLFKPFDIAEFDITIQRGLSRNQLLRDNLQYKQNLEEKVQNQTALLWKQLQEMEQSTKLVEESYALTVKSLCRALDARDHTTESHSKRVVDYVTNVGKELSLSRKEINDLQWGAILHDIGKIGISDTILLKPGKLNPSEWDIMKRHPRIGYDMLKDIPFLQGALPLILHHHEKFDGTGYPVGLKGEEIPLIARIFGVVDVWDALLSDRPYRNAWPMEKVRQYLLDNKDTFFDPTIVDVFLQLNWD